MEDFIDEIVLSDEEIELIQHNREYKIRNGHVDKVSKREPIWKDHIIHMRSITIPI